MPEHQDFDVYTRTARWTKSPAPVVMQWTFDGEKRIAGFFVRQAPAATARGEPAQGQVVARPEPD